MDSPLKLSGETIDVNGELRVSVTVTNTGKRSGVEVVQLDSLRDVGKISENPLIKYEWMQLKGILDFLLERRRTLHLQLKILQRKLEKEEEVLNFFSSGERSTILEFAIHQRDQEMAVELQRGLVIPQDTLGEANEFNANNSNWSLIKAEREFAVLKARLDFTKQAWFFVEDLLALNEDDLTLAISLLKHTRKQSEIWKRNLQLLEMISDSLKNAKAPEALHDFMSNMKEENRSVTARITNTLAKDSILVTGIEKRVDRLRTLQGPIADAVTDASKNIQKKSRWLHYLRSPLAPYRIVSFIFTNGPRIILIVIVLFLFWLLSRWLVKTILPRLKLKQYKTREERLERIDTLSRAFRSGITIIFLFIGVLTLLAEFGINVSVILGGAAVFSLAVAFGAQSLIKDYFSGFMILSENQYRVGNVVRINNNTGVVEDITLRMTILRDLEGIAHFIPHSEIKVVSNMTHKWSRVELDIKVSYWENVDKVMEVVMNIATQLTRDKIFGKLTIDEPEMLGVDAFADSGVAIKILVKTLPLKQWPVRRELLRRIKNRFDELNIELQFRIKKYITMLWMKHFRKFMTVKKSLPPKWYCRITADGLQIYHPL